MWVASLKGHGQFGGRLVEIFFAKNLKAMTVARIAIGVLPPCLVLLMLARGELWLLVAFTLLLGASQGVSPSCAAPCRWRCSAPKAMARCSA